MISVVYLLFAYTIGVSGMTRRPHFAGNKTVNSVKKLNEKLNNLSDLLNATTSQLTAVSLRLESVETELGKKDSQLKNLTTAIGNLTPSVAYQVHQKKDSISLYNGEVFKFDTVTLNIGDAYNRYTGIFTAPVSGTYLFWAHIQSDNSNHFSILLKKQGTLLVRGYVPISTTYGFASITYITSAKRGEQVWLENSERIRYTKIDGPEYSSYGGVLLKAYV